MEEAFREGELSRVFNAKIQDVNRKDLLDLRPNFMINDNIVEGYTALLRRCRSCLISTPRLFSWSARSPVDRQFSREGLNKVHHALVPMHYKHHWTFAHLMTEDGGDQWRAEYYDSALFINNGCPPFFISWLRDTFPPSKIKLVLSQRNPQQPTGVDCGLFMLMGMRLIASGAEHLSQDEANIIMPDFRARVLAELLAGHLDPLSCEYDSFFEQLKERTPALEPAPVGRGSGMIGDPYFFESPSPDETESLFCDLVPTIEHDSKELTPSSPSISTVSSNENMRSRLRAMSIDSLLSGELNMQGVKLQEAEAKAYAAAFASEGAILHMLKNGVAASRRRLQNPGPQDTEGDPQLALLWRTVLSGKSHPLITRYMRYQYSLSFAAAQEELGARPGKKSRNIREAMVRRLCIQEIQGDKQKGWRAARIQAQKGSIWVALVDMFRHSLGEESCVALAAVPESSWLIESMTAEAREVFLATIQSRVNEPRSNITANLHTAKDLYLMVINNTLPNYLLRIEGSADLPFLDAVSLEESPARYHIP